VTVLQFAGHRRRLGPLRAIAEFLFEAKRQTGGGAARIAHEFLFLLHGAFTARQTADAIADLLPQLMAIPEVQEDLAFVMHQIGDSFGAEAAFARAAHWQHESIARHPMAGSGLRFLQPRWLITSLGETASRLNYFVKSGLLEFREQISPVLLAPPEEIAHRHFLRQFRPWIAVVEAPEEIEKFRPLAAELGYDVGTIIFKNGRAMHNAVVEQIVEAEWHRRRLPPLLSCDAEDESAGREALRRWGLGAEDWFVALHVRAPGYHGESDDRRGRDIGIRNADIATYEMAIRRITSRGGWVIRIGDPSMPKLPAMHRVVDYAHSADRHPSIDMFLFAAARLFIGTNSGPAQVAYCFNQRLLLTNWHPFSMPPPSPHYMWLPRFYVDARNGEPLALRRCLTPPLRRLARGSALDEYGVRLVDNAPEEIAESVDAMLAWIETGTPPKSAMELRMDAIFAETGNLHSARMAPPALRRYAGELAG
jgi:putative glycosyltransferase (TIGR04372 family)